MVSLGVISWFIFAFLVGVFAEQRRNRSGPGWTLLAIISSPLLAFLLLAILPDQARTEPHPLAVRADRIIGRIVWAGVITLVAFVAVLVAFFVTSAHAGEQTRFYDSRGNSVGTATRNSEGTTVFRDSRGNVVGREYRR